jgi:hypothetical protein
MKNGKNLEEKTQTTPKYVILDGGGDRDRNAEELGEEPAVKFPSDVLRGHSRSFRGCYTATTREAAMAAFAKSWRRK